MKQKTSVLIAIFILLAAVALFFLFNLRTNKSPSDNDPQVFIGDTISSQEFSVNGMDVSYIFSGDDFSDNLVVDVSSRYNKEDDVCEITVASNFSDKNSPIFKILGSLATCYGEWQLGFPTDNLDSDANFINNWIRLYNERCDEKLEPLGFKASDGQCEDIPLFTETL